MGTSYADCRRSRASELLLSGSSGAPGYGQRALRLEPAIEGGEVGD